MSKIKIKAETKSKNTNHKYIGKGLKVNNKITYYDEKIKTQIILSDKIVITRESEYYIELNLKEKIWRRTDPSHKIETFGKPTCDRIRQPISGRPQHVPTFPSAAHARGTRP